MRGSALAALAATLALVPASVFAHPFTLNDYFGLEAVGQVAISPDERRLVFERQGPIRSAPSFEHDYFNRMLRSELFLAETPSGEVRRLLPAAEGAGHLIGSWSPEGSRLLVYRLQGRRFSAGVVDPERGEAVWLDGTPELAGWGRAAAWLGEGGLLLLQRPDGDPPFLLSAWEAGDRLTRQWASTAEGREPSRTRIGSGAFQDLTPAPAALQLVRFDLKTGRSASLAEGAFYDMEASPDGRFVALAAFGETLPVDPAVPFLQGQYPQRRVLTIVDLQTGDTWSPDPDADLAPGLLAWSPAGGRLLVWTRRTGEDWSDARLEVIDPSARTRQGLDLGDWRPTVIQSPLRTPMAAADWLGDTPVVWAHRTGERNDWIRVDPDGPVPLTSDLAAPSANLAAIDAAHLVMKSGQDLWRIGADGAAVWLGETTPQAFSAFGHLVSEGQRFQYNHAPRRDWILAAKEGVWSRVRIRTGERFGPPLPPEGRVSAASEGVAARTVTDDRARTTLVLGYNAVLIRTNAHLGEVEFAVRHEVRHPTPAGGQTSSWLYTPAVPGAEPPPLIVIPYPGAALRGPDSSAEPGSEDIAANVQLMTAAGFAVLVPSLPRSHYPEDPSADLAREILVIVDAAGTVAPFDAQKIALWGHSFGGHAVLSAAVESPRFSAVVALNGAYELISAWGEFSPNASVLPERGLSIRSRAGWVETGQGRMGAPPWAATDRYLRNSPALAADRITAPMLLIHGDRDFINPGQAEAVFSALYRQNKDAVLLTYRGEGHILASPANIADMYGFAFAWLRTVLDREPGRTRPVSGSSSQRGS